VGIIQVAVTIELDVGQDAEDAFTRMIQRPSPLVAGHDHRASGGDRALGFQVRDLAIPTGAGVERVPDRGVVDRPLQIRVVLGQPSLSCVLNELSTFRVLYSALCPTYSVRQISD
jgi:hypothetical protein